MPPAGGGSYYGGQMSPGMSQPFGGQTAMPPAGGMDPYGYAPQQDQQGVYGADPYAAAPPPQGQDPYGAYGASGGSAGQPPRPPGPPANFQLGALLGPVLKVKVPAHTLQFDEQYFLHLLAGSISLTKDEKKRIVESIPKLKQTQIDELVRIFEEERRKFAELGQEHVAQLEKLAQQHYQDWTDIELAQEQEGKASEDAKKAEELRKQIGL